MKPVEMESQTQLDPANDTRPTPAAAAACSDRDLAEIVYRAMQRSEYERAEERHGGPGLSDDELVARVMWDSQRRGLPAQSRERILRTAEHVRNQVQKARVARRLAAFEEAVGKRYAGCTLDNFRADRPEQRDAVAKLREYVRDIKANVDRGRGLVLFGPAGTGKDHLLVGTAKEAISAGIGVAWRNGRDLFGAFRDAMDANTSERSLFRDLEAPDVLILSDPAPPTGRLTEYQGDVLFRLVDARYRELRPIWTTLNVAGGDEADSRIGAQIADRLRHDALAIFCDWPSHRKVRA